MTTILTPAELAAALRAIAAHYQRYPELPSWCSVSNYSGDPHHLQLQLRADPHPAQSLLTWADTLISPTLKVRRLRSDSGPTATHAEITGRIRGITGHTEHRITVWDSVPGLGDYLDIPDEPTGRLAFPLAVLSQFHAEFLDHEVAV